MQNNKQLERDAELRTAVDRGPRSVVQLLLARTGTRVNAHDFRMTETADGWDVALRDGRTFRLLGLDGRYPVSDIKLV